MELQVAESFPGADHRDIWKKDRPISVQPRSAVSYPIAELDHRHKTHSDIWYRKQLLQRHTYSTLSSTNAKQAHELSVQWHLGTDAQLPTGLPLPRGCFGMMVKEEVGWGNTSYMNSFQTIKQGHLGDEASWRDRSATKPLLKALEERVSSSHKIELELLISWGRETAWLVL